MAERIINIKELNLDMIPPTIDTMFKPEQGGAKIVVIGKPGTGKTTLIASLLHEKKHIYPIGMVMCGVIVSIKHSLMLCVVMIVLLVLMLI